MPDQLIPLFTIALQLKDQRAQFFNALVHYTQEKSITAKKTWLDRMISIQYGQTRSLDIVGYELCRKWYFPVIREILRIMPIKDNLAEVGSRLRPKIKAAEVREALETLEKLKLAFRDLNGRWRQTDAHITFAEGWKSVAVREFQLHSLDQAKAALEAVPPDQREISMVTLTTSSNLAIRIRERIQEFREEIVGMVKSDELSPNSVQQVILCAFPLTSENGK
jgi:uncharacterized protein (TIGR02147 family)